MTTFESETPQLSGGQQPAIWKPLSHLNGACQKQNVLNLNTALKTNVSEKQKIKASAVISGAPCLSCKITKLSRQAQIVDRRSIAWMLT
jgi:hypothetical protein